MFVVSKQCHQEICLFNMLVVNALRDLTVTVYNVVIILCGCCVLVLSMHMFTRDHGYVHKINNNMYALILILILLICS